MPQITQLATVFASQLFWLAVVFGIIFFVVGRRMVPQIRSTVAVREQKIAEDVEKAKAARAAADTTEAEWRARMDEARLEAARVAQEARRQIALENEARIKAALDKVDAKVDKARQRIWTSVQAARAELETVASDAAQQMVQQLTGLKVGGDEAARAVAAELQMLGGQGQPDPAMLGKGKSKRAASRAR